MGALTLCAPNTCAVVKLGLVQGLSEVVRSRCNSVAQLCIQGLPTCWPWPSVARPKFGAPRRRAVAPVTSRNTGIGDIPGDEHTGSGRIRKQTEIWCLSP